MDNIKGYTTAQLHTVSKSTVSDMFELLRPKLEGAGRNVLNAKENILQKN